MPPGAIDRGADPGDGQPPYRRQNMDYLARRISPRLTVVGGHFLPEHIEVDFVLRVLGHDYVCVTPPPPPPPLWNTWLS